MKADEKKLKWKANLQSEDGQNAGVKQVNKRREEELK